MARTVPIETVFLGNTKDLEAALIRAGVVADESAKKIAGSADMAGRAAAEQAKVMGLSATDQEAAAGKAAVAFTEASSKITAAQRAAGDAAATAARTIGASLDEQKAAYARAIASQSEYEAAVKRSSDASIVAAKASADAQVESAARQKAASDSVSKFGGRVAAAGIAAFAAAAYEGVKGATDLQKSMEMLHTQAGSTQAEVGKLTAGVLNMAGAVGTSPQQLSDGLYHVASSLNATLPAATRAATELKVLQVAAEGAKVGNANLTDVTNALDAAIVSGISGVQNYKQGMGALNAIVGAGDMKMQDLADALGTGLLAPMKTYGLTLKDVGGALAVFGDENMRGQAAATKLSSAVRIMAAPSVAASKALGSIGLSTLQLANDMRSGGLVKALTDLHDKLIASGATASQQALVITRAFGGRQSTGVQVLLDQLDRLKAKTDAVGKGANQFGGAWQSTTKTLSFQFDQLKATAQALADKFGAYLIPKLEALGQAVQVVIGWFQRHQAAAVALGAVITGVLGTAVTVFAYTKAVAFVKGTEDMVVGLSHVASGLTAGLIPALERTGPGITDIGVKSTATAAVVEGADAQIEASNATAGASFVAVGTDAGTMALDVQSADSAIEVANTAAGASFTAMLGPIGLAVAAVITFHKQIESLGNSLLNFAKNNPGGSGGVLATGSGGGILGAVTKTASNLPLTSGHGSNWSQIAGALEGQGFNKTAIAGILGNFAQETGGGTLSGINTRDSGSGASGMGGMGIAQWTAGRRVQEQGYAAAHHESSTSLAAQVGYLVQTLKGSYHDAFKAIQDATSPAAAAKMFNQIYEGGTDPGGVRERAAAQAYKALSGSGAPKANKGSGTSGTGLSAAAEKALGLTGTGTTKKAAKVKYGAPQGVENMLNLAQELVGAPYSKAGHAAAYNETVAQIKKFGTDCSGLVSVLLKEGVTGIQAAQTTQGLPSAAGLAPGAGKYVTVYDRHTGATDQEHTLIEILGKYFESGGNSKFNPSGGVSELTKAQAAGELAGGGFQAYHPTRLNAAVKGGTTAAASVTGSASSAALTTAINNYIAALNKAAQTLIATYQNLDQSGTVRTLSRALGLHTNARIARGLHSTVEGLGGAATMKEISAQQGPVNKAGFSDKLTDVLAKVHGKALDQLDALLGRKHSTALDTLVTKLVALHGTALNRMETKLEASHSKPMRQLGQDLTKGPSRMSSITSLVTKSVDSSSQGKAYESQVISLISAGQVKQAEALVAAHKAAMATLAQEIYAEQVMKDAESLEIQATQMKDMTTLMQNTDADQLNIVKAQQQLVEDAAQAQVTLIRDMTQSITDVFAGVVQAIQDATQSMGDMSAGVVQGITDQTQIQVDTFGERGLYGLNLVAQKLTVQYDVLKAGFDQQIAAATLNLDAVTSQAHINEQQAQLQLDQVTTSQDQLVALSQNHDDTVRVTAAIKIAAQQAQVDTVTLHEDVSIVGPAQAAVDMGATLPKAQQDVLNAQLKKATESAAVAVGVATKGLTAVTDAQNAAQQTADNLLQSTQDTANKMVGSAGQTLATVTGQANESIANAQEFLQGIQNMAAQQEAILQSEISVTQAEAQTQFAGTGTTVNIYGIPTGDATAIAGAVDWVARTQIGVPA